MHRLRLYPFAFCLFVIFGFQNCGAYLIARALIQSKEDNPLYYFGDFLSGNANTNIGLVHYWPLDGDANDKVGSLHLTAFGTAGPTLVLDRNGSPNGAFHYDGIDSWHNSGLEGETILTGTASFTFSAWVKGEFKPQPGIIMGQGDGLGFQLADNASCFQIRAYSTNQGTGVISNLSPCGDYQEDVWYHVTLTWDLPTNTATLYVGNELVNSGVYDPNRVPWTSGSPFTLGYGTLGGGSQVVSIDEVRIYDRVVSPIFFPF